MEPPPKIVTDRLFLKGKVEWLRDRQKNGELDSLGREALAEGSFRLALQPDTPVTEGLDLLQRAVRLDGANPKFAYHLARLYFLHDEFVLAARWLEWAHRLCPTSHRIWCHISLLQRELNRKYYGNPDFEADCLKERSDKITAAIRNGQDNLDPVLLDFQPSPSREAQKKSAKSPDLPEEESLNPSSPLADTAASPKSPRLARRFLGAQRCRWDGVRDLSLEQVLEGSPSQRNLRQILPVLQQLAEDASRQPFGPARLAILAAELLVCGYHPEVVRQLRRQVPLSNPSRSLELLDLICSLFEAREDDLPGLLASALGQGLLPPLLAACIHQRRLLWRPLEFRSLVTYRNARNLLKEASPAVARGEELKEALLEGANEYARKLRQVVQRLVPEKPQPVMVAGFLDEKTEKPDEAEALRLFEALETATGQLQNLKNEALDFLKQKLEPLSKQSEGDARTRALTDRQKFTEIQDSLKRAEEYGRQQLDTLAKIITSAGSQVHSDFGKRKDDCKQELTRLGNPGSFRPILRRIDNKLAAPDSPETSEAAPSPELLDILRNIQQFLPGCHATTQENEEPPPPGPESPPPPEGLAEPPALDTDGSAANGLAPLRQALEETETALAKLFQEAYATFAPYSPELRTSPPIQALWRSVRAQEAETRYRLGHQQEARRIWTSLLQEDRLDAGLLKNLAVCSVAEGDLNYGLVAWPAYAEMLYFLDIVSGSPRPRAQSRCDFHRAFGNAHAPAFLWEKLDHNWGNRIDELAMLSFCARPIRVRNFVEQKFLEFLNAKLSFTSPPLLLGVARTEGEQARRHSLDTLLAFTEEVTPLLPPRVQQAFRHLAERHFQQAYEACASARRLTGAKDPNYAAEEKLHLQLLKDFLELKFKLVRASRQNKELVKYMTSVDFFSQLVRLDRIPIGLSHDLLRPVAGSLGLNVETAVDLMERGFCQGILSDLLEFVFTAGDNSMDQTRRDSQYRLLVSQWVKHPALENYLDAIDDGPQRFYPPEVGQAVSEQAIDPSIITNAIAVLFAWHERYVELTTPAVHLAHLLIRAERNEEAIAVLRRCCDHAFHQPRVEEIKRRLQQLTSH